MEVSNDAKLSGVPPPSESKSQPRDPGDSTKSEADQKLAQAEFKWEKVPDHDVFNGATDSSPQLELLTEEVSSSSISFSWNLAGLIQQAVQPSVAEPKVTSAEEQRGQRGDKQLHSKPQNGAPPFEAKCSGAGANALGEHLPIAPAGANLKLVLERWEEDSAAGQGKFTALAVADALNSPVSSSP